MILIDPNAEKPYLLDGRYWIGTLVRCKDCKWHSGNECTYEYYYDEYDSVGNPIPMYDDDFCSFGVRKESKE